MPVDKQMTSALSAEGRRRMPALPRCRVPKTVLVAGFTAALMTVPPGSAGAQAPGMVPLPSGYWQLPLAPQGEAPSGWNELERSLAPRACGECHADQYRQWQSSLHARAFSPGLVGQLLTFDEAQTSLCMQCHAPLAEQRADFETARAEGSAHLAERQGLAAAGNSCGGCHLRGHRRHGPPQRDTGATGQSDASAPHGGVYRTTAFERSDFCSVCHQFPQDYAVNGKPLQNTYVEWRASPQAARGLTCQGCHMPERQHLWRGIHDPEMVAGGLTPRFHADRDGVRFELANSGVGHAFPTYVTPRVVMRGVVLDGSGAPRPGTAVSYVIQRVVGYRDGAWVESSDTRLLPGERATLALAWQGGKRIRVWLDVEPDAYYDEEVYDGLLQGLPADGEAARLIAAADARAHASRYRLFETVLTRPE